ncbi:Uncharacterised protein [uncultured archaeon]|nr:Uncharacterised protein [uncultured archaeon]
MADFDTRAAYVLAGGILLGAGAFIFKWMPGADALIFAAAPAAALFGHFVLQSWRNGVGRDKLEPLMQYGAIIAFCWILMGWLFARSAWVAQEATLLALALLVPAAIDWLLERTTLKAFEPEPEPEMVYEG